MPAGGCVPALHADTASGKARAHPLAVRASVRAEVPSKGREEPHRAPPDPGYPWGAAARGGAWRGLLFTPDKAELRSGVNASRVAHFMRIACTFKNQNLKKKNLH